MPRLNATLEGLAEEDGVRLGRDFHPNNVGPNPLVHERPEQPQAFTATFDGQTWKPITSGAAVRDEVASWRAI
jgi:hypothetical protein